MRILFRLTFLAALLLCLTRASISGGQANMPALLKAAAADELPLPAWGPYTRNNVGPCCLVNRQLLQQFAFPIVISQQRDAEIVHSERDANGKLHVNFDPVVLLRRAMGLSPVQAEGDDRALPGASAASSRQARLFDADSAGLLWRTRMEFAPAAVTQSILQRMDAAGSPIPPQNWGAGEATVDYFPAYADPAGDGLLVRVMLTNRGDHDETYCVDLLGGMDTETGQFAHKDLSVTPDPQGGSVVVQHPHCAAVFALAANTLPYPLRAYRVGDDYFTPGGAVTRRAADRAVLPYGQMAQAPAAQPSGLQAGDSGLPPPASGSANSWALLRLCNIPVTPGQTVTLFLGVGVGSDSASAQAGAQTLLNVAEDAMPGGQLREGAYTKALRAHEAARFAAPDEAVTRLIAQALGNVPLMEGRRLGVPSRQPVQGYPPATYDPTAGGMIALAYTFCDPLLAAAELNAYFHTRGEADTAPAPNIPPTNLFALWELYQRTHNSELLAQFYPAARRRYQQFQRSEVGGQGTEQKGRRGEGEKGSDQSNGQSTPDTRHPTPDFLAYLIRSAKLMAAIARETHQLQAEIAGYEQDAQQATQTLNDKLWDSHTSSYTLLNPATAPSPTPHPQPPTPSLADTRHPTPDTLSSLLPLIAGADALPAARRAALLKALTDPTTFWSPSGLREVSKASPDYQPQGAVRPGMNWLFWKTLLDLGETATARKLADTALSAYEAAQRASGGCPEWLDGNTGAPGGALDYSGDACGLIPLYAAYHLPGTVSTGWNVLVLDRQYDAARDSLRVIFRSLEPTSGNALLCTLGKPNRSYTLTGAIKGTAATDSTGVLTLITPKDSTTQELDISPAGPAGPGQ